MTQTEFTQRVLAMQDRLYRVSCTLLRCEADREDAVQSALEKAWRGRFLLRQEQYMETWLTRILINECYAIMRRSRRIIPMAEVGENQPAQWEAQNADEMLCRALTALPDTLRLPIVLHALHGGHGHSHHCPHAAHTGERSQEPTAPRQREAAAVRRVEGAGGR